MYRKGWGSWFFEGAFLALLLVLGSSMLFAQMGMMRGPSLMGMFHPKVGAGGVYAVTDARGQSSEMEIAIVGKEDVGGTTAYWLELSFSGRENGPMGMKYLMAPQGDSVHVYRVIMSNPRMGVMEMPEMMISRMNQSFGQTFSANELGLGKNLGTEIITTKAGPMKCTHWQKEIQGGTSDVWINGDVYPTSLVKGVSKTQYGTTTTELIKQITDAKTKITGEPQKMPMPGMPPGHE